MEESVSELSSTVRELNRTVAELERRLTALEKVAGFVPAASSEAPPVERVVEAVPAGKGGEAVLDRADSLAPLFGWALLGMAGAYLLRALTESGAIPQLLGAGAGILYAAWWLFLAARRASERPLFNTVHGLTAALILAPMLWEITARFHLVSAPVASAVLVCFAVWGLAIGWRRNNTAIAAISVLAGLITATALFRETHDAAALAATFLLIATAVEFSACRDHWLSLRWVVAMAADLLVLLLTMLVSQRGEAVVNLPPAVVLATQVALITIYLSSTVDRTLLRGLHISRFEIGQTAVAFLISVGGALHLAEGTSVSDMSVGLFCLLGGVACYLISFAFLDHQTGRERNFYTYSTYALLLTTAGLWVLLSGAVVAAVWAMLAAGMMCAGILGNRITLRVHSAVYLLLAAVAARFVQQATESIIRTAPAQPGAGLRVGYLFVLLGAALCYAQTAGLRQRVAAHWTDPVEAVLSAALLCWGAAGVVAYRLLDSPPLRTALLTALALGCGWCGRRWKRVELVWLVYPLIVAAGIKLVAEDFRQGHSITLFASLIFFGGALIALPRLLKR